MGTIGLLVAAALLFGGASAAGEDAKLQMVPKGGSNAVKSASARITYTGIFFRHRGTPVQRIPFTNEPDAAALNIPFRSGRFGMVSIRCTGFSLGGHLKDCRVSEEPAGLGYGDSGEQLARMLKVDEHFRRSIAKPVDFVIIQARLANSDTPARLGPCWPPTCNPVPPPPPPPPSRLLDDLELEQWYDEWEAKWRAASKLSADRLSEARRAASDAGGFSPNSEKWMAARSAAFRFIDSRNAQDALISELMRFRSRVFQTASPADLKRLTAVIEGSQGALDQAEKNSTQLLLSLLR